MTSARNATRLPAVRIELNAQPEYDGVEAEQWPTIRIKRSIEGFSVHHLDIDDGPQEYETESSIEGVEAAEAWEWMMTGKRMFDYPGVYAFVGPGEKSVKIKNPKMLANHWRVYFVGQDRKVKVVGEFTSRHSAIMAAKIIIDAGLCPIVLTPLMAVDREWTEGVIVRSSEVSEALRRAFQ